MNKAIDIFKANRKSFLRNNFFYRNEIKNPNIKIPDYDININSGISRNVNIKNSVRNKMIEYPNDDNLNKSNQNQYLKPKLVTQYTKRNSRK